MRKNDEVKKLKLLDTKRENEFFDSREIIGAKKYLGVGTKSSQQTKVVILSPANEKNLGKKKVIDEEFFGLKSVSKETPKKEPIQKKVENIQLLIEEERLKKNNLFKKKDEGRS
jgi:hypothetical protein